MVTNNSINRRSRITHILFSDLQKIPAKKDRCVTENIDTINHRNPANPFDKRIEQQSWLRILFYGKSISG
jgi:hypothetical protein